FSATADEPVHIASGYDWITRGVYVFDPEHPPLARGLFGLGLRAGGVVSPPPEDWQTLQPTWLAAARGMDLLWHDGRYIHNLANARRGNLVFLLLALIVVAAWAWRAFGPGVALLAVALFGSLPPVLAHAGLATTDMAAAATLPLALFALERWLERRTLGRGLFLGTAIGVGLVAKLSFVLFFVVGAAMLAVHRTNRTYRTDRTYSSYSSYLSYSVVAAALAIFIVWATYGFDFGTMEETSAQMPELVQKSAGPPGVWIARNLPIPAPSFAVGVMWAKVHQDRGHSAFLLGRRGDRGWWYYFPVALALKTPLPFLLLFFFGAARLIRTPDSRFVWIPVALLISVLPVTLNIGVRHVLALYPMMAIVAAFGARELWLSSRRMLGRGALVLLLAWHFIGTSLAHPDYLPWFNEAAAGHPEKLLGDSNLDWGQDLLRLSDVAREEQIPQLSILLFGPAGFDRVPLPPHQRLAPRVPTQGWIAVSETELQLADPADYAWLAAHRPVRRVGKSIRLYYIQ
ncbi:MAG TPA: glycosyltransferase family 39 protein, partial [Thermoanaerobaculia bacterium]|nr:glycosyltransferase family 39 protein [Thermoanaerobaculia bacterium]